MKPKSKWPMKIHALELFSFWPFHCFCYWVLQFWILTSMMSFWMWNRNSVQLFQTWDKHWVPYSQMWDKHSVWYSQLWGHSSVPYWVLHFQMWAKHSLWYSQAWRCFSVLYFQMWAKHSLWYFQVWRHSSVPHWKMWDKHSVWYFQKWKHFSVPHWKIYFLHFQMFGAGFLAAHLVNLQKILIVENQKIFYTHQFCWSQNLAVWLLLVFKTHSILPWVSSPVAYFFYSIMCLLVVFNFFIGFGVYYGPPF